MLIDDLIYGGCLKTPEIIKAFQEIKRVDFLPDEIKNLSEINEAFPIGAGQTISQPAVVAFMLELLCPKAGDKILDIGSGSGWTSALLAHIVSDKELKPKTKKKPKIEGKVIAIEIIPELKEFGEENVAKYNFIEKGVVEFLCADGSKGFEKEAPFNKILVSAAACFGKSEDSGGAKKSLEELKNQVKIGGRIVIPIKNSIWLFIKKSDNSTKEKYEFEEYEYPGFAFVPLIEKTRNWRETI